MRNWRLIENPNLDKGMVYDFYESSEVNEVLNKKDREISRLNKLIKKMSLGLNENIAQIVDGNANYWKELCDKRTKMYLEEQARANALGEQLQKEIHKPFQYIEKLKVMKVAFFKRMAETAFYHYKYLDLLAKCHYANKEEKKILERKKRQWILFDKKVKELEKELNEE